ncbi:MAG: hypothetical protein M5R36_11080 [Deltaproteobacteria bacterium]|nr:hypothetical protein [Deltaproteobacteria bacterium]
MADADLALFRALNGTWTHPWLDAAARGFQPAWPAFVIGLILAGLLIRRDRRLAWTVILGAAVAVGLSDALSTHLIKPLAARPRPSAALGDVRLLLGAKSGFGFPSNHAANLAALATVLGLTDRRFRAPGRRVGRADRIHARVRRGSLSGDVLAGFGVGAVCGTIGYAAAPRVAGLINRIGVPWRRKNR